jgi:tRNA G18 (ribose-2'-O)-methylase SpoU
MHAFTRGAALAAVGFAAAYALLAAAARLRQQAPAAAPAAAASGRRPLRVEVMLHNVSKPRNLANALRCAAALGVDRTVLVGQRKADKAAAADEAADPALAYCKYMTDALALYEREAPVSDAAKRVVFAGLEIMPGAVNAADAAAAVRRRFPACDTVVVVPGNEGTGLSQQERAVCDMFVIVPQSCRCVDPAAVAAAAAESGADAGGGAGSLNVNTATAIALQQLLAHR